MYKILLSMLLMVFMACNSKTPKTSESSTSGNSAKTVVHTWAKEDEMETLDGCVENAKARLGEEKAIKVCNCFVKQLQEKNPSNDSVKNVAITTDTAQVAAMFKNCE